MSCARLFRLMSMSVLAAFSVSINAVAEQRVKEATGNQFTADVLEMRSAEEKEKLLNTLTGLSTGGEGVDTVLENFLPLLGLSGLLAEGDDASADSDQMMFDYNFLLFGEEGDDKNAKLKAVLNREPEPSEDLIAAVGEEQVGALQDSLDNLDDVTVSFTYNVTNQMFGRSVEANRDLFKRMTDYIVRSSPELDRAVEQAMFEFMAHPAVQDLNLDENQAELLAENEEARAALQQVVASHQRALDALNEVAKSAGLSRFYQLVSNQPQLQITIKRRSRDEIVGADEISIKVVYEKGLANINDVRRRASVCSEEANACLLDQYKGYLEQAQTRANLNSDNRFSFALEYVDVGSLDVMQDSIAFSKGGSEKLIGSVGYGRSLVTDDQGDATLRMDAVLDWEEHVDNDRGNDRFVATLALTRKLGNGIAIPISLVYANKSEFLSDTDEQISAHLGIKYEFGG